MKKEVINQIIAFVIIGLMLNLPIVMSADNVQPLANAQNYVTQQTSSIGSSIQSSYNQVYNEFNSKYQEYLRGEGKALDLGEAIILNVRGYEPSPIPQSAVENQEVPVYVYLTGTTFGTIASYVTGQEQPDVTTGITNIPPIKEIIIKPDDISLKQLKGYPKYIKPAEGKLTLSNLGVMVLTLNRIKDETKVPSKIDLNFSAEIYFDLEKGSLFGLSNQNLILRAFPEEKVWLNQPDSQKGGIFSNRAFIRATRVSGNSAQFVVYDKNYHIIPAVLGTLSPGYSGTDLYANSNWYASSILTLTEGAEVGPIRIGSSGDLFMDSFMLKLNKIMEPQDKALIKVSANGKDYQRIVVTGSQVYPDSKWKISSITQDPVQSKKPKRYSREEFIKLLKNRNVRFINGMDLSAVDLNSLIPEPVYVRENRITLSSPYNSVTLTTLQATIDEEGKNNIFNIKPLTPEEVSNLESIYCPKISSDQQLSSACTAMDSFKQIIKKYPSNNLLSATYFNLAEIYFDNLIDPNKFEDKKRYLTDMNNLAYYYYNRVLEFESDKKQVALERLERLTNAFGSEAFLEDEGVYLQVIKVIPLAQQDSGTVKIKTDIGGSKEYKQGTVIDGTDGTVDSKPPFKWTVNKININSVILQRTDNELKTVTVSLNQEANLDKTCVSSQTTTVKAGAIMQQETCSQFTKIKVESIDVPVELDITATPGTGKAYSTSDFQLHLLIDKRPFELSPAQLRKKINQTQELINKLDKIIIKLDKLVREWKKTCLVTSAYLMIKNSFLVGNARNEARKTVMPIYNEQCNKELKQEGVTTSSGVYTTEKSKFRSLSGCYLAKSEEIEATLDVAEESVRKSDTRFKDATKQGATGSDAENYRKFIAAGGTNEEYKNYLRYEELEKTTTNKMVLDSVQKRKNDIQYNQKIDLYTSADLYARTMIGGVMPIDQIPKEKKKDYDQYLNLALVSYSNPIPSTQKVDTVPVIMAKPLTDAEKKQYGANVVESGQALKVYSDKKGSPEGLNLIRPTQYYYELYNTFDSKETVPKTGKNLRCIAYAEENDKTNCLLLSRYKGLVKGAGDASAKIDYLKKNAAIDSEGRPIYIKSSDWTAFKGGGDITFISSTTQEFTEGIQIRRDYAQKSVITAEYTSDGYPHCYPLGDLMQGGLRVGSATVGKGDYALILDWYKNGLPKEIEIWNVGPNGIIECGRGDDQRIATADALKENKNAKALIEKQINSATAQCKKEGDKVGTINVGGKTTTVACSTNRAKSLQQSSQPQCTDLMDPSDCKLLFNVCDPVLCPTSRCNLGGRWKVDNVVATGLIGSMILCLPNRQDGVVVPVCLTGILAGLKNIKTILEGYKSCLTAALEKHENVGLCDYIRSVGICELAWKEVIALLGAKGGVLDYALEKTSPNKGGGEYLNFRQSFDQLSKSFNYFTTEYSQSLLSQYKAKSTQEIGSEVCRMAVSGKFPNLGQLLNELAEPEEPPQFMAVFDESPSVLQAGVDQYGRPAQGQSIYRGFYHIYAGKAYTGKYLTPSEKSNLVSYSVYLKNTRDASSQILYITKVQNGQLGRSATLKRGTYVQESINVYGATGYNQICVVINGKTYCGFGKTSSAFAVGALQDQLVMDEILNKKIESAKDCNPGYSTTSPALGSITMPEQFGILNTGIVRICNPVSPGPDTKWTIIGDCGNDNNGKYLGKCWLDKDSISINDAKYAGIVAQNIEEKARNLTGQPNYLDTEKSGPALIDLNNKRTELIKKMSETPVTPSSTSKTITGEKGTPYSEEAGITKIERFDTSTLGITYGGQLIYSKEAANGGKNYIYSDPVDGNKFNVIITPGQFTISETGYIFYHDDAILVYQNNKPTAAYIGLRIGQHCIYEDISYINDKSKYKSKSAQANKEGTVISDTLKYKNNISANGKCTEISLEDLKNNLEPYYYSVENQDELASLDILVNSIETITRGSSTATTTTKSTTFTSTTEIELQENDKVKLGGEIYDLVKEGTANEGLYQCYLVKDGVYNYKISSPITEAASCTNLIKGWIEYVYDDKTYPDSRVRKLSNFLTVYVKSVTTQAIKEITGRATEEEQKAKFISSDWITAFTNIKTKVTINGVEKEIGYDEFIQLTISSELAAQALFQKGEYFMEVARREAVAWKPVIIVSKPTKITSEKEAENKAKFNPQLTNGKLSLSLDQNKFYKITLFYKSNLIAYDSVINKGGYFKEGKFEIGQDVLSKEGIDLKDKPNIQINIREYNGVLDFDSDKPSSTVSISGNSIEIPQPKVEEKTTTTSEKSEETAIDSGKKGTYKGQTCPMTPAQIKEKSKPYMKIIEDEMAMPFESEFVMAIITAESMWNPNAKSPSGALGIMQIMPATGKTLTPKLEKEADFFDPKKAIPAGISYLRTGGPIEREVEKSFPVSKYGKDVASEEDYYKRLEAFAVGYNGGPGRISTFSKWYNKAKDYVLPDETTKYYKKVMACYTSLKPSVSKSTTTKKTTAKSGTLDLEEELGDDTDDSGIIDKGKSLIGITKSEHYVLTFDQKDYYLQFEKTSVQTFKKSFSARKGAVAGTNLAFYSKTTPRHSEGLFIKDEEDHPGVGGGGLLASWFIILLDKNGNHEYKIITNNEYEKTYSKNPNLESAVRGLALFYKDKSYNLKSHCTTNSPVKKYCSQKRSRTAICMTSQGKIKLFVHTPDNSKGITVYTLADILKKKYDCVEAIQLDSGGSSAIGYRVNGKTTTAVSSTGTNRGLTAILLVYPYNTLSPSPFGKELSETTDGKCEDCKTNFLTDCTEEKCKEIGEEIGKTCKFISGTFEDNCVEVKKAETSESATTTSQTSSSSLKLLWVKSSESLLIKSAISTTGQQLATLKTITDKTNENIIAATNGAFFGYNDLVGKTTGRTIGATCLYIEKGKKYLPYENSAFCKNRYVFYIDVDNSIGIIPISDFDTNPALIKYALSGVGILSEGTKLTIPKGDPEAQFESKGKQRNGICINKNGEIGLFVNTQKISLKSLQQKLLGAGCISAINLDGGETSSMYTQNFYYKTFGNDITKNNICKKISSPSDFKQYDWKGCILNAILIKEGGLKVSVNEEDQGTILASNEEETAVA